MSDLAICVENLGKRYIIGHQRSRHDGLRHIIEDAVRAPQAWLRSRNEKEEFWALKELSFEVQQGEVVGIIGRNGAGKSTLLKLLSRITEPTEGRIEIQGRVASLLEVGTGFHPDLTGRENVSLNGAILGMSRAEIRRKFDAIVAFAEIEKFLDTPVKRYSSGMYVRLAFAVAAHLEPEILIVDEVLAVGDAEFQKKCVGKMGQISKEEGRTVLFVSHNMGVISRLCKTALLLESGHSLYFGPTDEAIQTYMKAGEGSEGIRTWAPNNSNGSSTGFEARAIRIVNDRGDTSPRVNITRPFHVEFEYRITKPIPRFRVQLRFLTGDGTIAFHSSDSSDPSFETKPIAPGTYVSRCTIPGNLLNEGPHRVSAAADVPFQEWLFQAEACVGFFVEQTGGVNARYSEKWPGAVCPSLEWQTEIVSPINKNG